IYGEDGRIDDGSKHVPKSIWCGIVQELKAFKSKESALKHRFHRLYALEVNNEIDVGSKLLQENIWSSFRRTPRSGLEQLELLQDAIGSVVLGTAEDRWFWALKGLGEFSVSSIRKAIDDYTLPNVSSQTRWIKEVHIKVNIHAWKVRLDCLPTHLKLSHRSLDIPSIICPICGRGVESSAHLFFVCDLAKDNFRKICRWWNVEFMKIRSFDEWASWVGNLRMSIKHKRLLEGVCFGLWLLIWSFRNKMVFGVDSPSKATIFDNIVLFSFYWSRKSKAGKRYGFVRFIRVYDVDHLVSNLCTLWMGSHHLHANVARFQRPPVVNSGGYTHQNGNYVPKKTEDNSNNGSRTVKMSYVNVVNEETKSTEACEPALLLDESCLNQLDYSLGLLGKVKEFSSFDNMRMVLWNEGFNDIDLRYMGGMWIMIGFKTEDTKAKFQSCLDIEGIPLKLWPESTFNRIAAKWEKEWDNNVSMVPDSVKKDVNVQAEEKGTDLDVNNSLDPFELYPLLNNKRNMKEKMDKSNGTVSIPFPPEFTPCDETEVECDKKSMGNNEGSGFGNEKRN
nr:RNA-directed DNA polymerase, eukaryota [Tanacetum cinerariifolium]